VDSVVNKKDKESGIVLNAQEMLRSQSLKIDELVSEKPRQELSKFHALEV